MSTRTSGHHPLISVKLLENPRLVWLLLRDVVPAACLPMHHKHVRSNMLLEVFADDICG